VDDEHYIALGRAVYAFQALEWRSIYIAALLTDGDLDRYDSQTFGVIVDAIDKRRGDNPTASAELHAALARLLPLLREANQLRQDVLHAHPEHSDKVLRWRPKTDEVITIDIPRLNAAREHFKTSLAAAGEVWVQLWQRAWGDEPGKIMPPPPAELP